jgi:hypothetical protein
MKHIDAETTIRTVPKRPSTRRYFNTHQRPNQASTMNISKKYLKSFSDIGLKKSRKSEQIVRFLTSLNRDLYGDQQLSPIQKSEA